MSDDVKKKADYVPLRILKGEYTDTDINHFIEKHQESYREILRKPYELREEVLQAFIAKYKCMPDDAVMTENRYHKDDEKGRLICCIDFSVRLKTQEERMVELKQQEHWCHGCEHFKRSKKLEGITQD